MTVNFAKCEARCEFSNFFLMTTVGGLWSLLKERRVCPIPSALTQNEPLCTTLERKKMEIPDPDLGHILPEHPPLLEEKNES